MYTSLSPPKPAEPPRLLPARATPQPPGPAGRDGAALASPRRERSPSTCRTRQPGSSSTSPRVPAPLLPRAPRGLPRAPRVRALPSDKGRRRRPRRSGKRGPVPPPSPPHSPMLRPPAQARRSGSGSRRRAQAGHCDSIGGATGVEGAAPSRGRPGAEGPVRPSRPAAAATAELGHRRLRPAHGGGRQVPREPRAATTPKPLPGGGDVTAAAPPRAETRPAPGTAPQGRDHLRHRPARHTLIIPLVRPCVKRMIGP